MRIDILTLFPGMFTGPFDHSIVRRARDAGLLEVAIHDFREWATDRHRMVDDTPYGGGAGMVLKPEPLFACVEALFPGGRPADSRVILLTPQGARLDQAGVRRLAGYGRLVLLCGHYEGFDERVRIGLADEELSIGDYVLTGGEIPAMVVVDAVCRYLPGVLGSEASVDEESFSRGLLEYPQYTRPAVFRDMAVPDVLLSGNHAAIRRWREEQALLRTRERRPDLLPGGDADGPGSSG